MSNCALYFGWYANHANGPLLNPKFRFKKGAIAVHLQSFSASKIHPKKHWVGPILTKGAAATLGNVWEPYLSFTHNFDIFYQRLIAGYTLVEAAHMALPAHSWQAVVVGDPLYRPFRALLNEPQMAETDKAFRAFRLGLQQWNTEPDTLVTQLRSAAARMESGILYEALGLRYLQRGQRPEAQAFFDSASASYQSPTDQARQLIHLITEHRIRGEKQEALALIQKGLESFEKTPQAKSFIALRNIIAPPAPPQAKP